MGRGQCRSRRRDNVLHARHETSDEIKLAFANDRGLRIGQRALGFIEAEENFALGEYGCFRRIDVFGRFGFRVKHASAEPDNAPLLVTDRKNQTSAKTVVVTGRTIFAQDQAALLHQREVMAFAFGPIDGVVPQVRRVTEPEKFDGFGGNTAGGKVIARGLGRGFAGQGVSPALRDLLVDLQQPVLNMAALLLGGIVVHLQRDFGALSQPPHSIRKFDVLVFLDECENIAAFVAAEAMENLLLRIDVETRGLFLVKRAQRSEVRPGALQRDIGANDIHDVAGRTYLLERCRRKKSSHETKKSAITAILVLSRNEGCGKLSFKKLPLDLAGFARKVFRGITILDRGYERSSSRSTSARPMCWENQVITGEFTCCGWSFRHSRGPSEGRHETGINARKRCAFSNQSDAFFCEGLRRSGLVATTSIMSAFSLTALPRRDSLKICCWMTPMPGKKVLP